MYIIIITIHVCCRDRKCKPWIQQYKTNQKMTTLKSKIKWSVHFLFVATCVCNQVRKYNNYWSEIHLSNPALQLLKLQFLLPYTHSWWVILWRKFFIVISPWYISLIKFKDIIIDYIIAYLYTKDFKEFIHFS